MFSLIHPKGSIPIAVSSLPDEAAGRAVIAVEEMLLKARADEVSRAGLRVAFSKRFDQPSSGWSILKIYVSWRGEIEANASGIVVRYCLSIVRLVTMISAFILVLYILFFANCPSEALPKFLLFLLLWLWVVAGNVIVGGVRFRTGCPMEYGASCEQSARVG